MFSDSLAGRGLRDRSRRTGEALRVLVIDENPRDRVQIEEAARQAFPGSRTEAVSDPFQIDGILDAGEFEMVVADHRPSWIDAFHVLARVRERNPDLPVLLCTGTGSEELAVAAMKAGFDDYVLKHPHHFPRLASAMRSALEESTRRRAARESESRYRTLFEGVPVGLYRGTLSGQILDANPALIELLGFPSRESLMAVNLRDVYADASMRRTLLEKLEREGEVHGLELRWKRYGGQIITVRVSARPIRDPSGRLLHYEGVVEDVTERKRSREELQESNQFRQEIIQGAGEGIVVYDRDLRYIVWNRYMEKMTGLPADRVLGRRALDLFPFLRENGIDALLQRALGGDTASSKDVPYTIPETGLSGWAIATYGPHRNAAGQIVGVIGMVHDVTERRRAEQALRESEERFRLMADAAPVMIWTDDADGMTTYFNKPWLDFTGRKIEQELGLGSRENIHPDDVERFAAVYTQAQAERRAFQTEYRLRRRDGEYRWMLETAMPRFTAAGAFEGFIGSVIDMTDRRRAEENARAQHAFLRKVIDTQPSLVFAKDWNGRFTLANQAVAEIYGTTVEALIGKTDADFNPNAEEIAHFQADDREVIREKKAKLVPEEQVTDSRGVRRWFQTIKVPLARAGGVLTEVLGVATDITARKQTERIQSALYRIAARTNTAEDIDAFFAAVHEIVGELMYAKNFYVALYDPATDMLSFPYCVDEFDPTPAPRPLRRGLTEYVLKRGEPLLMPDEDFPAMVASGEVEVVGSPSVDWLGVPLKVGGSTFGVLVVQSYDPRFRYGETEKDVLTFVSQQIAVAVDRKRAQERLRDSEERYRLLFERNLAGVYRVTLGGRILECNDALAHMFGYASRADLVGRDVTELYPSSKPRDEFRESLFQFRSLVNYEMRGQRRDGTVVWTLENAALLADEKAGEVIIEGTVTDITARKVLEEQLRQSQKMEAIGQLAGGIAHDFNNLLTTVLGYSNMALNQLSPHEPIREEIEEIQKAGERAANLTRQLLAFSRKQLFEPRVLDVNALIVESSRMLARLIGEHIRFVTDLEPDLGHVRADPGQIEQVIVNLVVNARDAMPDGGTLTIRTRNAGADGALPRPRFGAPLEPHIVISVQDTGVGIDAETQKRIFEPFFTTKEKPHGTGLGLATVYGIVSQSGGQVVVVSEPGRGAQFDIYLPLAEDAPEPRPAAEAPAVGRGSETILLVEDEDAVRDLTRRCLEARGYRVLQASSAEEAEQVLATHLARLDLLLTDVVMPGASGPELARRLQAQRRDLNVLFVSGYTDDSMAAHRVLDPGASFLQKPFTPDTLARKVREVLDARQTVG